MAQTINKRRGLLSSEKNRRGVNASKAELDNEISNILDSEHLQYPILAKHDGQFVYVGECINVDESTTRNPERYSVQPCDHPFCGGSVSQKCNCEFGELRRRWLESNRQFCSPVSGISHWSGFAQSLAQLGLTVGETVAALFFNKGRHTADWSAGVGFIGRTRAALDSTWTG